MKKISLFAVAVITSMAMFAQDNQMLRTPMAKKTMFGIDVGANLTKLHVDRDEFANPSLAPSTNTKTSFHVGAFVDIPLGGIASLKPSVMYSQQGSKVAQTTQTGTGSTVSNYEEDLNYIYVAPAALKLMSPGGFIFETGPMVGFLLNASQEGPAPYNNNDIKDRRRSTDFMWTAGIGFMSRIGLGAHARYNHGFSNVIDGGNTTTNTGKMENRLVQLGLMYAFGAHK